MGLDLNNLSLNTSQIYSSAWKSMPPELLEKFNFALYLGKIILFLTIAYLIVIILIKIIGFFFKVRETKLLKNIHEDMQESNKKLAEITDLLKGSKAKKKS